MNRWTPTTEQVEGAVGHGQIEPEDFYRWLADHDREVHNAAIKQAASAINELRNNERFGDGGPYDLRDARDFVEELLEGA